MQMAEAEEERRKAARNTFTLDLVGRCRLTLG